MVAAFDDEPIRALFEELRLIKYAEGDPLEIPVGIFVSPRGHYNVFVEDTLASGRNYANDEMALVRGINVHDGITILAIVYRSLPCGGVLV